jgi:prevent-host-death family protein
MRKITEIQFDELRDSLSECVQRASAGKERFVVTVHGKATCALVPLEDHEKAQPSHSWLSPVCAIVGCWIGFSVSKWL